MSNSPHLRDEGLQAMLLCNCCHSRRQLGALAAALRVVLLLRITCRLLLLPGLIAAAVLPSLLLRLPIHRAQKDMKDGRLGVCHLAYSLHVRQAIERCRRCQRLHQLAAEPGLHACCMEAYEFQHWIAAGGHRNGLAKLRDGRGGRACSHLPRKGYNEIEETALLYRCTGHMPRNACAELSLRSPSAAAAAATTGFPPT